MKPSLYYTKISNFFNEMALSDLKYSKDPVITERALIYANIMLLIEPIKYPKEIVRFGVLFERRDESLYFVHDINFAHRLLITYFGEDMHMSLYVKDSDVGIDFGKISEADTYLSLRSFIIPTCERFYLDGLKKARLMLQDYEEQLEHIEEANKFNNEIINNIKYNI